jgi:hypothetical protein
LVYHCDNAIAELHASLMLDPVAFSLTMALRSAVNPVKVILTASGNHPIEVPPLVVAQPETGAPLRDPICVGTET